MSSPNFTVTEHVILCQHIREYPRALKKDAPLKQVVKQYMPLNNRPPESGSITIIATHANGIPKECLEPLWDELLKASNVKIRNIWAIDCSHQGASGVLNENVQGDDPSWFDYSRDLLYAVNHFRDEMKPPIIAIGHSFSCCSLVHLSVMHPRLFTGLMFIEPMMQSHSPSPPGGRSPARWTSLRGDLWNSRAEAETALRKNPFYSSWDKRVVDRFLQVGLRPLPTAMYPDHQKGVTLTTTKAQEAWTFLRFNAAPQAPESDIYNWEERVIGPDYAVDTTGADLNNRTFVTTCPSCSMAMEFLPYVRPPVLYVFGERSHINTKRSREEKLERTGIGMGGNGGWMLVKKREEQERVAGHADTKSGPSSSSSSSSSSFSPVQCEIIPKASHMAPVEKVADVASRASRWLDELMTEYHRAEELLRNWDFGKSERHGMALSKRWMEAMHMPVGTKRAVKVKSNL